MRVWGYCLLILGAVFLVLMLLAQAGGAHMSFVPFFFSVFLIAMGWSFVRSGKGLVRDSPGVTSASPSPTALLPMTPEITAIVRQQRVAIWRIVLCVGAGCLVVFAAIGAVTAAAASTGSPGERGGLFIFFLVLGIITAGAVIGISWLSTIRAFGRDLHAASYVRTTGPIQIVPVLAGGAMLRLADRAFLMSGKSGIAELKQLTNGTVDYSPYGHVILAVWDAQGQLAYCAPGNVPLRP